MCNPTWNPHAFSLSKLPRLSFQRYQRPSVSSIIRFFSFSTILSNSRNKNTRIKSNTISISMAAANANAFISSSSIISRSNTTKLSSSHISPFESSPHISPIRDGFSQHKNVLRASVDSTKTMGSYSSSKSYLEADSSVPMPIVLIDQDSDSEATIVQLSFGDRLGALIDTMKALKDLGLDVAKGTVTTEDSVLQTKFFIKRLDTARKVEDPDMLERIRLTIINNLLKYHPESSERLAMGEAFGIKAPEKKLDVDIATHIHVKPDGPKRSLLYMETADRPGLLLEVIKIMADINVNVVSAEIDTEGLVAKDTFHVNYRGAALNSSLSQVLTNCLRYYLRRPETDEDSY